MGRGIKTPDPVPDALAAEADVRAYFCAHPQALAGAILFDRPRAALLQCEAWEALLRVDKDLYVDMAGRMYDLMKASPKHAKALENAHARVTALLRVGQKVRG